MKIEILGSASSIHTIKWANYLVDSGHEVLILSFDGRGGLLRDEIEALVLPRFSNPLAFILKIIPAIKKNIDFSPSVVHVHSIGSYGVLSLFIKSNYKVITPWGSDILLYGRNLIKKIVLIKVIRDAWYMTCDSWEVREKLISLGAVRERIRIINFGVDTIQYQKSDAQEIRRHFVIATELPIIISTRSLEQIYNIETLLLAVNYLKSNNCLVKLLVIGSGPEEQKLRSMTFQLGIDHLVIFIGRVENSKLAEYLNAADVYVSTALSDAGIAASTAEAMSCELPCVITNVRENGYWIEDSVNGFLFEARNYEELAMKIRIIIENPSIGDEFGKKARAKILDSNDYYSEMKKAENLYLERCMNE